MTPQGAILVIDAISLMNGHKTVSEMIDEIPVRKPQPKPHQGKKEIARRLRQIEVKYDNTKRV